MSLLEEYVRRFNEGIRTGDFGPMAAAFTDDAEMHFEGVDRFVRRPRRDRGRVS